MNATYDLNGGGVLILTADVEDREAIAAMRAEHPEKGNTWAEAEALESFLANSELEGVFPEETGDLTSAPMLGLREWYDECGCCGQWHPNEFYGDCRDDANRLTEDNRIVARWAFMDYQVRSFLDDLVEHGRAVFVSGKED